MDNPYAPTDVAGPPATGKIIRKLSWSATALQVSLLLGAVVAAVVWTRSVYGASIVALVYLIYSRGSRALLTSDHRRGMTLLRSGHAEQAITAFEQSYAFFSRHAWLDRYRAVTMLSPSAFSYREMALCNVAHCHAQLGDASAAEAQLRRALEEFPDSGLAARGLEGLAAD